MSQPHFGEHIHVQANLCAPNSLVPRNAENTFPNQFFHLRNHNINIVGGHTDALNDKRKARLGPFEMYLLYMVLKGFSKFSCLLRALRGGCLLRRSRILLCAFPGAPRCLRRVAAIREYPLLNPTVRRFLLDSANQRSAPMVRRISDWPRVKFSGSKFNQINSCCIPNFLTAFAAFISYPTLPPLFIFGCCCCVERQYDSSPRGSRTSEELQKLVCQ